MTNAGRTRRTKAFLIFLALALGAMASSAEEIWVRSGTDHKASRALREGQRLAEKGDLKAARARMDEAIRLDPTMWVVYYNRALVSMAERKYEAVVQDCTLSLRNKTHFVPAATLRATANLALGHYRTALDDMDRVIGFGPAAFRPAEGDYYVALDQRAWLRATCPDAAFRNGANAMRDAKIACNATIWKEASYIDTLAAACAEAGDFDAAVRYEAQALAKGFSAEGGQHRLALYKERRPYRQGSR